jgi:hypothetical protein
MGYLYIIYYILLVIYNMSSQIFKTPIPNELFFNLLNDIAFKIDNYYMINNDAYKKGIFNNKIQGFINECIPYYHKSKLKYLEKKNTYNSFITVVRQICKFNKITYTSKIKYDRSSYDIIYYIYF